MLKKQKHIQKKLLKKIEAPNNSLGRIRQYDNTQITKSKTFFNFGSQTNCSVKHFIYMIKLSCGYFIFGIFGLNFNLRMLIFNFWSVKYKFFASKLSYVIYIQHKHTIKILAKIQILFLNFNPCAILVLIKIKSFMLCPQNCL